MEIRIAAQQDLPQLAQLLWSDAASDEQDGSEVGTFVADLATWWADAGRSHMAFIAHPVEGEPVGMAWLAMVARPPRPGATARCSADIQSVFVLPANRGNGIGTALVKAATQHGLLLGASRVTVRSGRRAVPVYERLGFVSSRQLLQSPAT
jgi:GNAT superfamily N-acetyltransferase